jgi:hypothetical protein
MKRGNERDEAVRNLLQVHKIGTMEELKDAAQTVSTMTMHRCLSRLGYLASYSHRGRFYTLTTIPDFDTWGLWSWQSVMFSRYGNLLETATSLVNRSEAGLSAGELEAIVQVEAKHCLLQLQRQGRIARVKIGGRLVYVCTDAGERRRQELMRSEIDALAELGGGLTELLPDELRAGIVLFYSLLDEKQRRLYAGLEAAKLGHGGDRKIAKLLDLNSHTVAKGRRELFSGAVDRNGVRSKGGGRKPVEKKRLR